MLEATDLLACAELACVINSRSRLIEGYSRYSSRACVASDVLACCSKVLQQTCLFARLVLHETSRESHNANHSCAHQLQVEKGEIQNTQDQVTSRACSSVRFAQVSIPALSANACYSLASLRKAIEQQPQHAFCHTTCRQLAQQATHTSIRTHWSRGWIIHAENADTHGG